MPLAQALQDKPEPRALANKILGLVFFNPSLRTLASFQAGMARLGGSAFVITPGLGHLAAGDPAERHHEGRGRRTYPRRHSGAGLVLRRAGRARICRRQESATAILDETLFGMIDELCDKPLINMESAMNHPCQALADWRTLDELKIPTRAKFVLSWAYHPKALPLAVPAATVHMAAMRGMEVVVLRPEGFALPAASHGEGALGGARCRRFGDRDLGSRRGAQRARAWCTPRNGAPPRTTAMSEADSRLRADLSDWCVRERWFERALPDAKLMHCLPVRRNVAVADEVLDGPRAVVKREAFNRLPVQMAVLHRMLA